MTIWVKEEVQPTNILKNTVGKYFRTLAVDYFKNAAETKRSMSGRTERQNT